MTHSSIQGAGGATAEICRRRVWEVSVSYTYRCGVADSPDLDDHSARGSPYAQRVHTATVSGGLERSRLAMDSTQVEHGGV